MRKGKQERMKRGSGEERIEIEIKVEIEIETETETASETETDRKDKKEKKRNERKRKYKDRTERAMHRRTSVMYRGMSRLILLISPDHRTRHLKRVFSGGLFTS